MVKYLHCICVWFFLVVKCVVTLDEIEQFGWELDCIPLWGLGCLTLLFPLLVVKEIC